MLGYLLRSQFKGFFKNNFGALLAAVFVGLGWALKMPFASKQVEEISEVEIKWASLGLQIISEFFFHTSLILASLPISVFETLSITTSFFWSPRLVERVLIVWTTFFVVSGIALYVYLHEVSNLDSSR